MQNSSTVMAVYDKEISVTLLERDGTKKKLFVKAQMMTAGEDRKTGTKMILLSNNKFYIVQDIMNNNVKWSQEITTLEHGPNYHYLFDDGFAAGENVMNVARLINPKFDYQNKNNFIRPSVKIGDMVVILSSDSYRICGVGVVTNLVDYEVTIFITSILDEKMVITTASDLKHEFEEKTGDLSELSTISRDNLVEAINELNLKLSNQSVIKSWGRYFFLNDETQKFARPNDLDISYIYDLKMWRYYSAHLEDWVELPKGWQKLHHLVRNQLDALRYSVPDGTTFGLIDEGLVMKMMNGCLVIEELVNKGENADIGTTYYFQQFYGEYDGRIHKGETGVFLYMTEAGPIFSAPSTSKEMI